MAKQTLGLDIGSSSIKIVQLKRSKKGYSLVNFGIEPIPPQTIVDGTIMNQGAVVDAIRELKKATGLDLMHCKIAVEAMLEYQYDPEAFAEDEEGGES